MRAANEKFDPRIAQLDGWRSMPITPRTLSFVNVSLAVLVGIFAIVIALMTLKRGVWLDEFTTISYTTADQSPREFLRSMTQDLHAILDYGIFYLLQSAGVTDVVGLRSINLLGLPLVIFAIAYGIRHTSINLTQALLVWILFASSPIFFGYFAELRCYFLIYSASIATSVVWYVQMRHIEAEGKIPGATIAIWAVCLAIFVNLHYFAMIFGGMLTATLLTRLAVRGLWRQVLVIGSVSLAAAAPSLILGAFQFFSGPAINEPWIVTSPTESIKMSIRMVEGAAARNIVVVAGAIVMCVYILEDRKRWIELQTPVILLCVVGLFLSTLVLINAKTPIMVDRYLIAGAGAVTFSLAILAASSSAPVWLPAAVSAIALLLQGHTLYSNLGTDERGWLPSARAVAQLKSECPTTKIFVRPVGNYTNELNDIAVAAKYSSGNYGYYAKKFHFSYEILQPGVTVAASGPCPSVIWIEHLPIFFFGAHPNADTEQALNEFQISKVGLAELKRYGSGALIVVRDGSTLTGNGSSLTGN